MPRVLRLVAMVLQVLKEQLSRNIQFFGMEGQQRIADAFVIVVGLGVSCADVEKLPHGPPLGA